MWPFNAGDCLIEVTTWAGLSVYMYMFSKFSNPPNNPDMSSKPVDTRTLQREG